MVLRLRCSPQGAGAALDTRALHRPPVSNPPLKSAGAAGFAAEQGLAFAIKMAKAPFACGLFSALVCAGLGLFLAFFVKLVIFSTKDKAT